MAQTGFTPIQLYRSTTASAVPSASNLTPGELAININDADMALYAENASGVVKKIMNNPAGLTYPTADGTAGQVMTTDGAGNVTFTSTVSVTTVDTTNLEVTNLKAKDGTSAGSIADSTGVVTLASSVLTTTDINGGTVDGAVIGGSSAAAITGTTITATGDVTIADKIVHAGDTNTSIRFPAADTVTVETSGVERLRITSAGDVGIGTTSPTADLSVGSATSSSGDVHLRTSKTTFELTPSNSDAGGMDINVGFVAGGQGPLKFSIGGSERMRIDASGNLGLGVTPSAWGGSWKAVELNAGSMSSASNTDLLLAQNAYNDNTNWRYKTTALASAYAMAAGQHRFFTAPSGTAGNAITFTQAMTLDASGRLGIGTTSPGDTLDVNGGVFVTPTPTDNTGTASIALQSNRSSSTQPRGSLSAFGSSSSVNYQALKPGYLTLYSAHADIALNADTSKTIQFWTGGSERARIDSSGNLLVGTTANPLSAKVAISGSVALNGAFTFADFQFTDISTALYGFWRIRTLASAGGARIDLSMHGVDSATPNAAQYTITFSVTTSGTVSAVSSKSAVVANTVLLVKDSTYLYLAVSKGQANGAGYWSMQYIGQPNTAFPWTTAANLTGYTTVYTV